MIHIEPTSDGFEVQVNHGELYARMDGLAMALSNVPAGLTVVAGTGLLSFVRLEPTVTEVTTNADDPRRVTIALVPGLASGALVAEVHRLLRQHIVPPDFLIEVTATELVMTNPSDSDGGGRAVRVSDEDPWHPRYVRLPDRDWPTRDRLLPRPQPTSEP